MAGRIFINYRRRESRREARHLATVLRAQFGKDGVFLDESGIDGGANWLHTLERQVAGSAAMVALIGKDWAELTDEEGNRLIELPNDFVRFEIAQALLRRIPLLPVLLDGAPMPRPAKLPDNLWPFTQVQAMPLRGESFEADAAAIGRSLRHMMAAGGKRPVPVWTAGAGLAAALAMGVAAGPWTLAEFGLPLPGVPGETEALGRVAAAERLQRLAEDRAAKAEQARDGLQARLDTALAGARRQADDAADAAKAATQRVLEAERKASGAETARKDAAERLAAAERERDGLKFTLGTAQTDGATAVQRAADANTKLAGLQQQLEAVTAQQARDAADLAAARRERDDARNALASANAKIADLQKPQPPVTAVPTPLQSKPPASRGPFRDCPQCPELVEVPAGSFMMGSPPSEKGRSNDEGPQRRVTIAKPFAVGRFEVTFDEWGACVADNGCAGNRSPSDSGWGQGRRPVINVSWNDAREYAAWLARKTGKPYRLLTEAEWEYAARAGSDKAYAWGDEIGKGNANCNGCGSQWDNKQTAPAGSFPPNAYGLYDMHGNAWEWVEDCWHESYAGAPSDGSAWTTNSCSLRVLRGGSWLYDPLVLRSAYRFRIGPDLRSSDVGFRVARTL